MRRRRQSTIFGLAPCLSSSRNIIDLDEAEPIPLERIISTERISGIKATLTDPTSLMVPGEDDWNDMVTIIKKHEKETALSESDLEELIENSGGYIGRGAEGVVLAVPEEVRVALGINKPAVIKIRNYIKPTVEDVANTFPEQAELLNSMVSKGVAPEVYKSGENYYIDEKLEGETIRNLMYKSLSPEQLKAYKLAKDDKEKKLILATALSPEQKAQLNILLDELTDTLAESGVAIDDFHGGNVMLVQTPEGTKAKVVDLGYAYTDDSETLRTLYDIKKRKLMAAGGYEADAEKLIKIRVTQRRAAENTIDFSSDFPLETEALEIAEVRQLKSALRAISVENEKVFSYIVSAGEGQRVRRIYEYQFRSA